MRLEELEKLQTCILKALREADRPLSAWQLAASCGTHELQPVYEAVCCLRKNGHMIFSTPKRGYWLANKNPASFLKASDTSEHVEESHRAEYAPSSLDQLCYPLDLVTLNRLIKERGTTMTAVLRTAGSGKGRLPSNGLVLHVQEKNIQVQRHHPWQEIWLLAQTLDVPPEMLIDETAFLYDGTPSLVPLRFAGYKLLFGALREGLHPLEVVPPQWFEKLSVEDAEVRAGKHPHFVRWLCGVYKGHFSYFSRPKIILHICARVNVPPAELFVGFKQARNLPLQAVYMDLTTLPDWDTLFLAAVARLLCKAGQADDATLITELSLLVRERGKWREKLVEKERRYRFNQNSVSSSQGSR